MRYKKGSLYKSSYSDTIVKCTKSTMGTNLVGVVIKEGNSAAKLGDTFSNFNSKNFTILIVSIKQGDYEIY